MEVGSFVKWALIVLAGWWLLNWFANYYASGAGNGGAGMMYGSGWAAPLPGPGRIRGWSTPWQRGNGAVNFGVGDVFGSVNF